MEPERNQSHQMSEGLSLSPSNSEREREERRGKVKKDKVKLFARCS